MAIEQTSIDNCCPQQQPQQPYPQVYPQYAASDASDSVPYNTAPMYGPPSQVYEPYQPVVPTTTTTNTTVNITTDEFAQQEPMIDESEGIILALFVIGFFFNFCWLVAWIVSLKKHGNARLLGRISCGLFSIGMCLYILLIVACAIAIPVSVVTGRGTSSSSDY